MDRLYCCDCTKTSLSEICADVVVTDPPYGINGGAGGQAKRRNKTIYSSSLWEDTEEYIKDTIVPYVDLLIRSFKIVILTPGNRNMQIYPKPDDIGCFWMPATSALGPWGFTTFQPIFYYGKDFRAGKGPWPTGIQLTEKAEQNGHPCPKPINAWTWLVAKASQEGETIFDPFMGSGTTGVSCARLGRKFVGMEIDENYYCIARQRINEARLQPVLNMGLKETPYQMRAF